VSGFAFDIQMGNRATGQVERVMPHLRYLNAPNGRPSGGSSSEG